MNVVAVQSSPYFGHKGKAGQKAADGLSQIVLTRGGSKATASFVRTVDGIRIDIIAPDGQVSHATAHGANATNPNRTRSFATSLLAKTFEG